MIRHEKPKTASSLLLPLLVFLASTTSSSIRCAHASSACGSASHSSTRRLSHPCGNSASGSSSTTAALYNENSLRQGGNTLLEVTMGTIAALLTILGVLFLIDREAFDAITCKTGERVCRRRVSTSACEFPDIDADDVAVVIGCNNGAVGGGGNDDMSVSTTPYERDGVVQEEYLTQETADYLAEKKREKDKRYQMFLQRFFPCLPTTTTSMRTYDSDKYATGLRGGDSLDIDGAGSDGDCDVAVVVTGGSVGRMQMGLRLFAMGAMDAVGSLSTEARASLCGPKGPLPCGTAKPTTDFPDVDDAAGGRDKYYVEGKNESDDWGEVKYGMSSYESDHTTPW